MELSGTEHSCKGVCGQDIDFVGHMPMSNITGYVADIILASNNFTQMWISLVMNNCLSPVCKGKESRNREQGSMWIQWN